MPIVAEQTHGRCRPCFAKHAAAARDREDCELSLGFSADDLNRLCSRKDTDDACRAIVLRAEARLRTAGFNGLTEGERAVLCAETFLYRMCREGAAGVVMTLEGDVLEHAEAALTRVGLAEYAPAARLLVRKTRELPRSRGDREPLASELPDDTFQDVDAAFHAIHVPWGDHDPADDHPHRKVLMKYVCANRAEFTRIR